MMEGYRDQPDWPIVYDAYAETVAGIIHPTVDYKRQTEILGAECRRLKNLLTQITIILEEGQGE